MAGIVTRREPCVCGATIVAPADDWPVIAEVLRRHYASARHGTPPAVARERAARRRAERRIARLELELVRMRRAAAAAA